MNELVGPHAAPAQRRQAVTVVTAGALSVGGGLLASPCSLQVAVWRWVVRAGSSQQQDLLRRLLLLLLLPF